MALFKKSVLIEKTSGKLWPTLKWGRKETSGIVGGGLAKTRGKTLGDPGTVGRKKPSESTAKNGT